MGLRILVNQDFGRLMKRKEVVIFLEIGQVNIFLSLTSPQYRMWLEYYFLNKKSTNKKQKKLKKEREKQK